MILIIVLLLLLPATLAHDCPSTVRNELELIALPLPCFHRLYDSALFDGHRISRVINERLEIYKRMLQEIKMQDKEHLQTTPVLKWAQSEAQIFISFKLSHRQDSPTCSDIRSESFSTAAVNATEGDIPFEVQNSTDGNFSSFKYSGECYFTSEKFLFTLNLHFQGLLSKAMLRKEGLGLYTLIGEKAEKAIWGRPFTDHKKAAIWPQLRGKYSSDMDKYFQMIEQGDSSTRKRRRRRPKSEQKQGKNEQL